MEKHFDVHVIFSPIFVKIVIAIKDLLIIENDLYLDGIKYYTKIIC